MIQDRPGGDSTRAWSTSRWPWLGLLIVVITTATFWNAWRHDYHFGYDIAAHINYAKVMATGRLPTPQQSTEFFTPPVPYFPAAVLYRLGVSDDAVGKSWQMLQAASGAGLLVTIALALRRLHPLATVVAFSILIGNTIWWRSLAMIRPEAFLATIVAVALYQTTRLFGGERQRWRFIACGLLWGVACVTRQWAIPALLGVVAVSPLAPKLDRKWWLGIATAAGCCAIVAAPFYLYLKFTYGSASAFNVPPAEATSLRWHWTPNDTAATPVAPHLDGQPINILVADMFGDYWMYYLVTGKTRSNNYVVGSRLLKAIEQPPKGFTTNVETILPQIRRSVWAGSATIALVVACVITGIVLLILNIALRRPVPHDELVVLAASVATLVGYFWFVGKYSDASRTTDTVKATYMFQVWPWLAVFTVLVLGKCLKGRTIAWVMTLAAFAAIAAATSPAWFSRIVTL